MNVATTVFGNRGLLLFPLWLRHTYTYTAKYGHHQTLCSMTSTDLPPEHYNLSKMFRIRRFRKPNYSASRVNSFQSYDDTKSLPPRLSKVNQLFENNVYALNLAKKSFMDEIGTIALTLSPQDSFEIRV
jgi:hypothetical protein